MGCSQDTVSELAKGFTETVLENQTRKAAADHATDFEVRSYNVWKQQKKTAGPGTRVILIISNKLY